MEFPKVLVISIESFSNETSNGRTLGQYFVNWPKNNIHQIFTKKCKLDLLDCEYFYLSESMIFRGFLTCSAKAGQVFDGPDSLDFSIDSENSDFLRDKHAPTPFNALLRDCFWRIFQRQQQKMIGWAVSFKPDVILVQCGKATYPFWLATRIAKKVHSKLALFSTEGFYFFDFNYFNWKKHSFLFDIYHKRYVQWYQKYVSLCSLTMYNSQELADCFKKELGGDPKVIYNSSRITAAQSGVRHSFLYAGNFGLGRAEELCDLSKLVHSYLPNWLFLVYGKASEEQAENFKKSGIIFKGFVDYEHLKKEIENAGVLVHVESFNNGSIPADYFRFAFSTKIADCICSGLPFLYYGPSESTVSRYLTANGCAFVCHSGAELVSFLQMVAFDEKYLAKNAKSANAVAKRNHDPMVNCAKMKEFLNSIFEK